MWPWELKGLSGHGIGHTLTVIEWYVNVYPIHAIASVVGAIVLLCIAAALAAIVARNLVTPHDPAKKLFGNRRVAAKQGHVK